MPDELEPLHGTYDWDRAFSQNPGESVYKVTDEQRRRAHDDAHPEGRMPVRSHATRQAHGMAAAFAVVALIGSGGCGHLGSLELTFDHAAVHVSHRQRFRSCGVFSELNYLAGALCI